MQFTDIVILILFFVLLVALAIPLGRYMSSVFEGNRTFISPIIEPLERIIYRLCKINPQNDMRWKEYAAGFTIFTLVGVVVVVAIQMLQRILPLNPQLLPGVRWDTAINTAVSFATNTNWQSYSGESTMSYFTQMIALTAQNFVSSGIGMTAGIAFIRGFIRKESTGIGNVWVDLTRSVLYVLLPLSIIVCLILLSQGVVQSFHHYIAIHTLEGKDQLIPLGPAASQIAIKQLGSNGGGFFNANSAHPFENPTMISNLTENISILLIPIAFIFMFGNMLRNKKQGRAVFYALAVIFITSFCLILHFELSPNPSIAKAHVSGIVNMEGKETRFGEPWSSLWNESTTVTSNGSVNSMHDSFMPLSGMIDIFNIGIGEIIFGGVGVGLLGVLFYVILAMFLSGLMIGRTPEFMGKKFGPYEMAMSMIALVVPMIAIIILSAIAISTKAGLVGLGNPSAHGLTEILYAYSSGLGNNGSAFAGLNANTPFYNLTLSVAMLIGRFATVIPALAIAGSLAAKKRIPESNATFPTTGLLFIGILIATVFIMGALDFFPVFVLGPILDHLFTAQMITF